MGCQGSKNAVLHPSSGRMHAKHTEEAANSPTTAASGSLSASPNPVDGKGTETPPTRTAADQTASSPRTALKDASSRSSVELVRVEGSEAHPLNATAGTSAQIPPVLITSPTGSGSSIVMKSEGASSPGSSRKLQEAEPEAHTPKHADHGEHEDQTEDDDRPRFEDVQEGKSPGGGVGGGEEEEDRSDTVEGSREEKETEQGLDGSGGKTAASE